MRVRNNVSSYRQLASTAQVILVDCGGSSRLISTPTCQLHVSSSFAPNSCCLSCVHAPPIPRLKYVWYCSSFPRRAVVRLTGLYSSQEAVETGISRFLMAWVHGALRGLGQFLTLATGHVPSKFDEDGLHGVLAFPAGQAGQLRRVHNSVALVDAGQIHHADKLDCGRCIGVVVAAVHLD
jgi:hypothetical protein